MIYTLYKDFLSVKTKYKSDKIQFRQNIALTWASNSSHGTDSVISNPLGTSSPDLQAMLFNTNVAVIIGKNSH